ncbi:hypothetical protein [Sphingomonas mollis]|uniref:Lipoprotein n=1 Tax=Sphingomonas mollis TaxID=2795726 RepID=A0ABS0XJP4_9SPHN|nr:hypothetical protein [Sphingomonas sp. BT553]MBJ6120257.1 hypothetical protein [Sphingomonas sp. BT553]
MKKLALATGLLLAGCATAPPAARVAPPPMAIAYPTVGLERVIGQDAAGLTKLFGQPDADVREGTARKLQFASAICILDTYLYPKDGAEPRVTYLDAREPDGSAIDRASCVAALTRRPGAR